MLVELIYASLMNAVNLAMLINETRRAAQSNGMRELKTPRGSIVTNAFRLTPSEQFLKPKSGMVSESVPWSITLKSINKTFNRLRKYKFDRKTKRWVDNGVAYTKGRVDSRGYVTPNII